MAIVWCANKCRWHSEIMFVEIEIAPSAIVLESLHDKANKIKLMFFYIERNVEFRNRHRHQS